DRRNLRDTNVAALLGRQAANVPSLPARIFELAIWISRVADQPTAIWWAAGQSGLHPDLKSLVRDTLRRQGGTETPRIRTAWQYLFESWDVAVQDHDHAFFQLQAAIKKDGWSDAALRRLSLLYRPFLSAKRPFWTGPKPPDAGATLSIRDIISLDV